MKPPGNGLQMHLSASHLFSFRLRELSTQPGDGQGKDPPCPAPLAAHPQVNCSSLIETNAAPWRIGFRLNPVTCVQILLAQSSPRGAEPPRMVSIGSAPRRWWGRGDGPLGAGHWIPGSPTLDPWLPGIASRDAGHCTPGSWALHPGILGTGSLDPGH